MPQESEALLRSSLDAVDSLRKQFLWEHVRSWAVLLVFSIAGSALAVCLHMTRMTRKILIGIELLSKG